jgi:hypothetical protein
MEPAEIILLKALFASEKANNPYYSQHHKYSIRLNLRGLYDLSDFLALLNGSSEDMDDLLNNSSYVERIGPKLVSLSAIGMLYCQKEFAAAPDGDKQQPVGFIK